MTAISLPPQCCVRERRKTVITSGHPRGFDIGFRRNSPSRTHRLRPRWSARLPGAEDGGDEEGTAGQRMADNARAEVESHRSQDGRAECQESGPTARAAEEREDG